MPLPPAANDAARPTAAQAAIDSPLLKVEALNQYYGPSLYPGAGVWLSTLLAAAGMLAIAATFYFWSVIFPRSGGVYVSLSRGLSPGFAFVGSLVETVILLYYAAFAASLIVKVGLSSFLATVGVVADNRTLLDWAASTAEPRWNCAFAWRLTRSVELRGAGGPVSSA